MQDVARQREATNNGRFFGILAIPSERTTPFVACTDHILSVGNIKRRPAR